ncbi:MAG TPA: peptidoglycan-associated lipoprotein Pal [Sphingomonadaceae bacterium]|nr:peptidoglycan-associated lipoprotein Pal [Sphingomonadaceae bacterium]
MRHVGLTLSFAAALLATTACSKKPPAELPPPPAQQPVEAPTATDTGTVQQGPVPGSKEDFLQRAGSDRVFFDTDQYNIDDEDRATLDRQAAWLARYPNVHITVEGHCDERGTREYNLALGERRANAAKNYLVNAGVATARISVVSYGKERPAVPGDDESAWAQNRRAVTVLLN